MVTDAELCVCTCRCIEAIGACSLPSCKILEGESYVSKHFQSKTKYEMRWPYKCFPEKPKRTDPKPAASFFAWLNSLSALYVGLFTCLSARTSLRPLHEVCGNGVPKWLGVMKEISLGETPPCFSSQPWEWTLAGLCPNSGLFLCPGLWGTQSSCILSVWKEQRGIWVREITPRANLTLELFRQNGKLERGGRVLCQGLHAVPTCLGLEDSASTDTGWQTKTGLIYRALLCPSEKSNIVNHPGMA